jgi:hypothetical protein
MAWPQIDWAQIDWAIVFATLLGPILAVWASEWRQQRRVHHDRKESVFRSLWSTRSVNLHPDHVNALNNIDFAFPERDYPDIADAWHLYLTHLNTDQGQTDDSQDRWDEKARSLLANLISLMASDLKIPFTNSLIQQPSYYPKGHAFTVSQQNEMRTLALEVLKGKRSLPIHAVQSNEPDATPTSGPVVKKKVSAKRTSN